MNCCKKIKDILWCCVFVIFIIAGITGFVSFFWNRSYFDLSTTVDDDLLGNLATFWIAILSTLALIYTKKEYEVKKEEIKRNERERLDREKEKQPILGIAEKGVFRVEDIPDKFGFSATEYNVTHFYQEEREVSPCLKLYNIGGGIAKKIKINWEFENKEIETKLEGLGNCNYYTEGFCEDQKIEELSWIPSKEFVWLPLPEYFMRQFGEKRIRTSALFDEFDKDIVKLSLKLTYVNIKDITRVQKFEINVGVCFPNTITLKGREVS